MLQQYMNLSPDEIDIVQKYFFLRKLMLLSMRKNQYERRSLVLCENHDIISINEQRKLLDIFNSAGLFSSLEPQQYTKSIKSKALIIKPGEKDQKNINSYHIYTPEHPISFYYDLNKENAKIYFEELTKKIKPFIEGIYRPVSNPAMSKNEELKQLLRDHINPSIKYKDITIRFTAVTTVKIQINKFSVKVDYKQLGFGKSVRGKVTPVAHWGLFQAIAYDDQQNYLHKYNISTANYKKQASKINNILIDLFGIRDERPIWYNSVSGKYKSRIVLYYSVPHERKSYSSSSIASSDDIEDMEEEEKERRREFYEAFGDWAKQ